MISEKIKELNIKLPNAPDPVGAYVAFKIIDKVASKGVIHKNKAANQKSRISKHINSLK